MRKRRKHRLAGVALAVFVVMKVMWWAIENSNL
jgi:nitrogen fixation-related uncharacterized protein